MTDEPKPRAGNRVFTADEMHGAFGDLPADDCRAIPRKGTHWAKQEVTYALLCQLSEAQRDALKKLGEEFGVSPGQMGTRLISDELVRMGLLPAK